MKSNLYDHHDKLAVVKQTHITYEAKTGRIKFCANCAFSCHWNLVAIGTYETYVSNDFKMTIITY